MAEYQSALIQGLRGNAPAFSAGNPGVTMLPNQGVQSTPISLSRRSGSPGSNLIAVAPAPAPAPYVPPPPIPVPPVMPGENWGAPPPFVTPAPVQPMFVPDMADFPDVPDVPDYTDDLAGPDLGPVPVMPDEFGELAEVEPMPTPDAEPEVAQSFPVPDQTDLQIIDLDSLDAPQPADLQEFVPKLAPEDFPQFVEPMSEAQPVPIVPADITFEPAPAESVSLPDDPSAAPSGVDFDVMDLVPEVPAGDQEVVSAPTASQPQPADQLSDQDLFELMLFAQLSAAMAKGGPEFLSPFPDFTEER